MVRMKDLLCDDLVIEDISATDKDGVIQEFARFIKASGRIDDEGEIVRVITEREALGSTGVGDGVAIPHGKMRGLERMIVAFGRSRKGVDFHAMDERPVYLFFLLLTPEDRAGEHLKVLARIARILKNPAVRESLMRVQDRTEIQNIILEEDSKYSDNEGHGKRSSQ